MKIVIFMLLLTPLEQKLVQYLLQNQFLKFLEYPAFDQFQRKITQNWILKELQSLMVAGKIDQFLHKMNLVNFELYCTVVRFY